MRRAWAVLLAVLALAGCKAAGVIDDGRERVEAAEVALDERSVARWCRKPEFEIRERLEGIAVDVSSESGELVTVVLADAVIVACAERRARED